MLIVPFSMAASGDEKRLERGVDTTTNMLDIADIFSGEIHAKPCTLFPIALK